MQFTDQTMEPFEANRSSVIDEQTSGQRHPSTSFSRPTFQELKPIQFDTESSQTYITAGIPTVQPLPSRLPLLISMIAIRNLNCIRLMHITIV